MEGALKRLVRGEEAGEVRLAMQTLAAGALGCLLEYLDLGSHDQR